MNQIYLQPQPIQVEIVQGSLELEVTAVGIQGPPGPAVLTYQRSFTQADLAIGKIVFPHNLNTLTPVVILVNDQNYPVTPADLRVIDANNLEVDLTGYLPLPGTWRAEIR